MRTIVYTDPKETDHAKARSEPPPQNREEEAEIVGEESLNGSTWQAEIGSEGR